MSPRDEEPVKSSIVESSSTSRVDVQHLEPNLVQSLDSVADQLSPFASPARRPPSSSQTRSTSESVAVVASSSTSSGDPDLKPAGMSIGVGGNRTGLADPSFKHSVFGIEMPFDVISAGFAALVATGGIIGYAKAGSVPSLVAGLTFGSILGAGAYLTTVNPNNYYLTAGTSAVLGSFMGYRFYNSAKFMPSGLICVMSVAMLARYSIQALTQVKAQRAD